MADREKLIELLDEASFMLKELCGGYNDGTGNEVRADHLIANGVTVRERGRWIARRFADDNTLACRCSVCHTTWDTTTNFCPYCGADMRPMEEANV